MSKIGVFKRRIDGPINTYYLGNGQEDHPAHYAPTIGSYKAEDPVEITLDPKSTERGLSPSSYR